MTINGKYDIWADAVGFGSVDVLFLVASDVVDVLLHHVRIVVG